MTEQPSVSPTTPTAPEPGSTEDNHTQLLMVIYVLYAIGLVIGITTVIGLIIAHVQIGKAPSDWQNSHYRWLIRTFWFALLWIALGVALLMVGVGFVVIAAATVWMIYRIVRGLILWSDKLPTPVGTA